MKKIFITGINSMFMFQDLRKESLANIPYYIREKNKKFGTVIRLNGIIYFLIDFIDDIYPLINYKDIENILSQHKEIQESLNDTHKGIEIDSFMFRTQNLELLSNLDNEDNIFQVKSFIEDSYITNITLFQGISLKRMDIQDLYNFVNYRTENTNFINNEISLIINKIERYIHLGYLQEAKEFLEEIENRIPFRYYEKFKMLIRTKEILKRN